MPEPVVSRVSYGDGQCWPEIQSFPHGLFVRVNELQIETLLGLEYNRPPSITHVHEPVPFPRDRGQTGGLEREHPMPVEYFEENFVGECLD